MNPSFCKGAPCRIFLAFPEERAYYLAIMAGTTFIVGSRVTCTCGFGSDAIYIDRALQNKITTEPAIGHDLAALADRVSRFGYTHYGDIGADRWKAEGHAWTIEHVWVDLEGWKQLRRSRGIKGENNSKRREAV